MAAIVGQMGSIASLVVITFERYVKIVHSIVHRKYFRKWMIYVTIALTWMNGVLLNITIFWTTQVVDGQCLAYQFWPSNVTAVIAALSC